MYFFFLFLWKLHKNIYKCCIILLYWPLTHFDSYTCKFSYPSFIWGSVLMKYFFFHVITFSLYVSSHLKSHKWHIAVSYVFICSSNLWLLLEYLVHFYLKLLFIAIYFSFGCFLAALWIFVIFSFSVLFFYNLMILSSVCLDYLHFFVSI